MIRIQIIDDHAIVRAGFKRLLEDEDDIEVILESGSGEAAIRDYEHCRPDIVIMDLSMPGMGGIAALQRIKKKHPDARILALSFHNNTTIPSRIMRAGGMGYLSKGSDPALLVEAVRQLMQGNIYIDPAIAQQMKMENTSSEKNLLSKLTARELDVFLKLAEGLSITEIAHVLYISPNTAGNHQNSIMHKLRLRNKVELVRMAMQENLIR